MTTLEHKEIKGITTRIMVLIIGSTISICLSIAGVYWGLKTDSIVLDLRVKILETQVAAIQADLKERNKKSDAIFNR